MANKVIEQSKKAKHDMQVSLIPGAVIQSIQTDDDSDRQTNYLGFPILANHAIWGVLSVYRIQDSFTSEDIHLLANIARQIGIGIETNLLRQQLKQAAVLSERQRVAHELHDSVNQLLYSLALSAQASLNYINTNRIEALKQSLQSITDTAQQALQEMRLMIYNLRPMSIESDDLVEALRQRLDFVEKRAGIQVQFDVREPVIIPDNIKDAYYHIAQEALNNVLKYAMAKRVIIRLAVEDSIATMEIIDDGIGFDKNRVRKGIGLDSMQARTEALGGIMEISSRYKQGTHITVSIPIVKTEAPQE
jgi:two-component system, NarL family, sensor kinase